MKAVFLGCFFSKMQEHQLDFSEIHKTLSDRISRIKENRLPICLLADGLNDTGNLGMIFRLADALRLEKVFLYGVKPLNFNVLKKKSRASVQYVDFEVFQDLSDIVKLKEKYAFVMLEKTNKSIPYFDFKPEFPLCLVIGSEKFGISKEILTLADGSIHLPMFGVNTSINVATATAVALYDIAKKYSEK